MWNTQKVKSLLLNLVLQIPQVPRQHIFLRLHKTISFILQMPDALRSWRSNVKIQQSFTNIFPETGKLLSINRNLFKHTYEAKPCDSIVIPPAPNLLKNDLVNSSVPGGPILSFAFAYIYCLRTSNKEPHSPFFIVISFLIHFNKTNCFLGYIKDFFGKSLLQIFCGKKYLSGNNMDLW